LLITFSGVDGSGKTTQLELLRAELQSRGLRCHTLWYRPGYSDTLNLARAWVRKLRPGALSKPGDRKERSRRLGRKGASEAWVTVATMDMLAQYALRVRYLLATHDVVICDRYIADALLDFELHFPDVNLGPLPAVLRNASPRPALALLLMVPWDVSVQRLAMKDEPFPDEESLRRVRYSRYVGMAESGGQTLVNAEGDTAEVAQRILDLTTPLLG